MNKSLFEELDNELKKMNMSRSEIFEDNKYNSNEKPEDNIIKNKNKCNNCNSKNLIHEYSVGKIICKDCGADNEQILDYSPEWRFYGSDDSKSSDPCNVQHQ